MMSNLWEKNLLKTRKRVMWKELNKTTPQDYSAIGFKCGLEVHQQLATEKKLFCRCPAGIYHDFDDYDAEIVRHMRPTLSELGEYDGTALMEFKTRKNIYYRLKNDSACTYEIDDTPPFVLNREALDHAIKVALMLKMNIVGELHITRKQYLDGSIPTGFQRTTILGIEGELPISNKTIKLIQFSVEEDSCREVSDFRHDRVYFTDRLGMPLIETVTYPEMLTPQEAAEACQNIRFIARSTGKVRVGIGAARQDVNVSVTGGTRVEIKGVAHISWIPKLTHNEAFRQVALLEIKDDLNRVIADTEQWKPGVETIPAYSLRHIPAIKTATENNWKLIAVNLPDFKNILSFFTQPGQSFADEISGRLKVIACLEKPNMFHSEEITSVVKTKDWNNVRSILGAGENDAQIVFWAPDEDIKTAIETIEERCQLAFTGVPNETRKSLPDGTTIFERVLPGPDRMYPDTDSVPISIPQSMIDEAGKELPKDLQQRMSQLAAWSVPQDAYTYILRNNLMPVIEKISTEHILPPKKIALIFAHRLKNLHGDKPLPFAPEKISDLIKFIKERKLTFDIIYEMLPLMYENPKIVFSSLLTLVEYEKVKQEEITSQIPLLHEMFRNIEARPRRVPHSEIDWIMGELKKTAMGNIPLKDLQKLVLTEITKEG
jgi:glutamyl-tRNA(Gln) amidotransferase subunit E